MSPLIYLLAAIGAAALVCSGAVAAVSLYVGWRDRHERAHWRRERRRMAAYHERMAAQNGRPHSDGVVSRATRRGS